MYYVYNHINEIIISLQFLIIYLISFFLLYRSFIKSRLAPLHDIYSFWLLVFILYTTIPPLFILIGISTYDPYNRLMVLNPTLDELIIYLNYIIFSLGGFFSYHFFYLKNKIYEEKKVIKLKTLIPDIVILQVTVLFIVTLISLFFLESFFGDFDFESRLEAYQRSFTLPLWYKQTFKILYYTNYILSIILLIALFQRVKNRFYLYILSFLYFLYLFLNIGDGGRSEFFMGVFIIFLIWHFCIHNFSKNVFLMTGGVVLYILVLYGLLRHEEATGIRYFSIGEFDVIYANTIELIRFKETNEYYGIGWYSYFGDILGWIPSQILPIEKTTLSNWFMRNFHEDYYLAGGGYGFGILSQSVVGFGYMNAFIFSIFIAFFLNQINKLATNCDNYWKLIIFIFIFINVSNTIRSTFFVYLPTMIQAFLPLVIFIWFINLFIRNANDLRTRSPK